MEQLAFSCSYEAALSLTMARPRCSKIVGFLSIDVYAGRIVVFKNLFLKTDWSWVLIISYWTIELHRDQKSSTGEGRTDMMHVSCRLLLQLSFPELSHPDWRHSCKIFSSFGSPVVRKKIFKNVCWEEKIIIPYAPITKSRNCGIYFHQKGC